jgi:hypothetical protein
MDTPGNPKQRNFVTGLMIILGLLFVIFFGLRTARTFRQFHEHRPPPPFATKTIETDVNLIRDWMTIPFISKMYQVKPHTLFEALAIPEQENHTKSLRQLNDEYYPQTEGIILQKVKAAVQAEIAKRPPLLQTNPNTPVPP